MKQVIILMLALSAMTIDLNAQTEYKVITSIESIVPGGLGRSRIIENTDKADSEALTTSRTDGKRSNQGTVKRKQIKVDKFNETKLLNFYRDRKSTV